MVRFVHMHPAATVKVLPGEPFALSVTLDSDDEDLIVEAWTDIPCAELKGTHPNGYAIRLRHTVGDVQHKMFTRTITPTETGFYSFAIRWRQSAARSWTWHGGDGTFASRTATRVNVEPSWSDAIIYNAFVRQFGARDRDGDGIILPGEGGTFADLIDRMDHFTRLGVQAIYLNPIQIAGDVFQYKEELIPHYQDETNHLPVHMHPGSVYSVKDYKSIDPELGLNPADPDTDQYHEFRRFVAACHARGIRVILDIVFGHTARGSLLQRLHPEWFLYKRVANDPSEPYLDPHDPAAHLWWGQPDHACSPYDHDIYWTDCSRLNWGILSPPAPNHPPLNHGQQPMWEYCKSVLRYWIRSYGVDGFRLDVAYSVPARFWTEAIADARTCAAQAIASHAADPARQPLAPLTPDVLFVGETYVDAVEELQECGITMLNGDFSNKIFTVETLKGYLDYLYNKSGQFFPHGARWMLFPECHDFQRLPVKCAWMLKTDGADIALNKSRWVLAATLPGAVMLHNGYEVIERAPLSVRSYTGIDWSSPKNITAYLAQVDAARNAHLALQRGEYLFVETEQGVTAATQLFAFLRDHRTADGKRDTILVVVNMDVNEKADGVRIHLPTLDGYDWSQRFLLHDLLTEERYERSGADITIVLGPGESHIFHLTQP